MERTVESTGIFESIEPEFDIMGNRANYNVKTVGLKALKETIKGVPYIAGLSAILWYFSNLDKVLEFSNRFHYLAIDANNWFYSILQAFI